MNLGNETRTHLEEGARRLRPLGDLCDFVGALGPHRLEDLVLRVEQKALEVLQKGGVLVLVSNLSIWDGRR